MKKFLTIAVLTISVLSFSGCSEEISVDKSVDESKIIIIDETEETEESSEELDETEEVTE